MKKFLALSAATMTTRVTLVGCAATAPTVDSTPGVNALTHGQGSPIDPVSAKVSGPIGQTSMTETAGPEVYYASGHTEAESSLPNPVGFSRSTDAGKTWQEPSLGGQLLTSRCGTNWENSTATFSPAVLAVHAANSVVLTAAQDGILRSTDSGQSWQPSRKSPIVEFAALAMSKDKSPKPAGYVHFSTDVGLNWAETGQVKDQAEAVTARDGEDGRPQIRAAITSGAQVSTNGGLLSLPAAS